MARRDVTWRGKSAIIFHLSLIIFNNNNNIIKLFKIGLFGENNK